MFRGRQPLIRIGIVEGEHEVRLRVFKNTRLVQLRRGSAKQTLPAGQWKVEVTASRPAQMEYRVALGTWKDRQSAEQFLASLREKGVQAEIKKHDLPGNHSIRQMHTAVYQVLLSKKFTSEERAKEFRNSIRKKTAADLVSVPVRAAGGRLRFTQIGGTKVLELDHPVRLNTDRAEIADIEVGHGFHWSGSEQRTYGGSLEFWIDKTEDITVVNELPLEKYLLGVVPSEMPAGFPFEALKAQAVAARGAAIAKMGFHQPGVPFDLCDDVHCQVYSGLNRHSTETTAAVERTRGMFVLYRDEVIDPYYSAVCGGHTEHNENVWASKPQPYLRGTLDRTGKKLSTSLEKESNAKRWIDSHPDVNDNVREHGGPKSVEYSTKYFRWQVEYAREDLETIIHDKTGEHFGQLLDLRPVQRGVSGRLIELEVVGTEKRFFVSKELAIRQALSKTALYSACFYILKQGRGNELPERILFRGAGWGHGVGMCQVGAAMMAHKGQKFDQILTHYYHRVNLKKLYN